MDAGLRFSGSCPPLDSIVKMDFGLSFQALRDGQVDAAMVTSTDGRIISFDILVLADDKNFFPIYLMTPVARKEVLDKNPKLAAVLESLAAKLDSDTILKLNAAVAAMLGTQQTARQCDAKKRVICAGSRSSPTSRLCFSSSGRRSGALPSKPTEQPNSRTNALSPRLKS